MRHRLLLIFALLYHLLGLAQTDTLEIESQVKSVTVYPEGAQITREITQSLPLGKSVLVLTGLPDHINLDNLQLGCNKFQHILSFQLERQYGKTKESTPEAVALKAKREQIQHQIKHIEKQQRLLKLKQELISKNNQLNSSSTTIPLEELIKTIDYIDNEIETIEHNRLNLEVEKETLQEALNILNSTISELGNKRFKNTCNLIVSINNTSTKPTQYTLTYYLSNAGWTPSYNLRVDNIGQPLLVDYHGTVYQNTGEDWKDVQLKLATIKPDLSESNAELETWFLAQDHQHTITKNNPGCIRGIITEGHTGDPMVQVYLKVISRDKIIKEVITNRLGEYSITGLQPGKYTIEASFIGYSTQTITQVPFYKRRTTQLNLQFIEDSGLLTDNSIPFNDISIDKSNKELILESPISSIIDNIQDEFTQPEFTISAPFTVLTDYKKTDVKIKSIEVKANYNYHIIPKLQKSVFLEAGIPDWNSYHFLNGNAKIYLKGKYIGHTQIDTDHLSDTLHLQLGKDKDIQVKRTYEEELSHKVTGVSKIKETITYSILVKNNKPVPVRLTVKDQIPITTDKDISVELLNKKESQAQLDAKTGQLTWYIDLKPKESKEIQFSYLIKYPKL